jgi:hypothetical protein
LNAWQVFTDPAAFSYAFPTHDEQPQECAVTPAFVIHNSITDKMGMRTLGQRESHSATDGFIMIRQALRAA